jgi:DNA repair protein RecO (recombination protein O)
MYINTTGLVLRETAYKDSSKILTVLTSTEGKLTVSARGALRRGSKVAAATQLLAYSDMTLSRSKDRWTLTEAQSIELFNGLSADLSLLSLGSYFAELLEAVSDEDIPNPDILSLGLNALYMLSEGKKNPLLVKTAFELRLMCLSGFEPALYDCSICGKTDVPAPKLDIRGGTLRCGTCRPPSEDTSVTLSQGSLDAMRYIAGCDPKKLFSFKLNDDAFQLLSRACEAYTLAQLDRRFSTLDYYKNIRTETPDNLN